LATRANYKPGDVLCIPALDGRWQSGFVLGRYIEKMEPNIGHLIEVFQTFHKSLPVRVDRVNTSDRLFRPIFCSLRFSEIPAWRVVQRSTDYTKADSAYEAIAFAFQHQLWLGGRVRDASPAELLAAEPATCWRMPHVLFRIHYHLAGIFDRNERYDYNKVPDAERLDNEAAKRRVLSSAQCLEEQLTATSR
jgi:hypothetical protein